MGLNVVGLVGFMVEVLGVDPLVVGVDPDTVEVDPVMVEVDPVVGVDLVTDGVDPDTVDVDPVIDGVVLGGCVHLSVLHSILLLIHWHCSQPRLQVT